MSYSSHLCLCGYGKVDGLHGYEEYGEEGILSKLRGMFAFTIWDSKKEKLNNA